MYKKDIQAERHTDGQSETLTDRQTHKQADAQTGKIHQAERHTDRQRDTDSGETRRQAERRTDRQVLNEFFLVSPSSGRHYILLIKNTEFRVLKLREI
jgi:hypothetical protein